MRYIAVIALVGCLCAGCASSESREATPWVHVLKRSDVVGVDSITRLPVAVKDGKTYTEEEIFDMTLLSIVKQHELVTKLAVFDRYLGDMGLSESQRRDADRTVNEWPEKDQPAYFRAASIVIAAIKELNPYLDYKGLLSYGQQIILPDPTIF